jgi:nitroreductase
VRSLGRSGQVEFFGNGDDAAQMAKFLASLLYAAEVHGFGSCPMSDWIRKSHFKLS